MIQTYLEDVKGKEVQRLLRRRAQHVGTVADPQAAPPYSEFVLHFNSPPDFGVFQFQMIAVLHSCCVDACWHDSEAVPSRCVSPAAATICRAAATGPTPADVPHIACRDAECFCYAPYLTDSKDELVGIGQALAVS